jgi:hypothetical protein
MEEPIERISITGFDQEGEPEIRRMADGSLYVLFEFIPPSWAEDTAKNFDDFDKEIAKAIGKDVEWEDRELFRIDKPARDTIERLQTFLESYPR